MWPQTIVQTCVVHLLRNTYAYASRKDWSEIAKDLKPVYTAPSEQAALDRFAEFSDKWEKRYPAIIRLWTNAWAEFVPFLQFDNAIRQVIYTTNAIESVNARIRRAIKARRQRVVRPHRYALMLELGRPLLDSEMAIQRYATTLSVFGSRKR